MRKLLFLVVVVISCEQLTDDPELHVINDTFLELVGTENYTVPIPPAPYFPIHPDSLGIEKEDWLDESFEINEEIRISDLTEDTTQSKVNSSTYEDLILEYETFDWAQYEMEFKKWELLLKNPQIDNRNLIFIVDDSLISYENNNLLKLSLSEYELSVEGFKSNFGLSSEWRTLATALTNSQQLQSPLNNALLTNTGKYEVRYSKSFEPTDDDRIVAYLTLSRVVFNSDSTKACFYFGYHCGGECGTGELVFAELTDKKWKVVAKRQLWVS